MPVVSSNSTEDSIGTTVLQDYDSNVYDDPDDTMEDPEDPIVLVEDYLTDQSAENEVSQRLSRKQSLATFKKRYYSTGGARTAASAPRQNKRALPDQEQTQQAEDLEAIFGKLPGADRLKRCAFCNKPLYEISSIICNANHLPRGTRPPLQTEKPELYDEFVCWECISVYEQFMCELDASQKMLKTQTKEKSLHLVDMLNSLRCSATADIRPAKKQTRKEFSPDLLGRLHYLSSLSEPTSGSSWLESLVTKLKWSNNLDCITLHCPIQDNNAH